MLSAKDGDPACDIQQAHERGRNVGQGRCGKQFVSMWAVTFLEDSELVQKRQGSRETGVELGRQRHEVDCGADTQSSHAGEER